MMDPFSLWYWTLSEEDRADADEMFSIDLLDLTFKDFVIGLLVAGLPEILFFGYYYLIR